MWVVTSLPYDNVTLINLYISSYRKARELSSSMQKLKSSSTSCFKYFVIHFARETNALVVRDLLAGLLYLYMKQAN